MSQFKVYKNEAEWEATYLVIANGYKKEGVELVGTTEGPKQYPCLAADNLIITDEDKKQGYIMYAYVYAGDCVDLLKEVDPTEMHKNLTATGRLWAADMVRAGYVDGDGPARFISQKLFGNLWSFLQELRTMIPAWSNNPDQQERGIDFVILLETLVQRCTEEGHEVAEEDVKPLLEQLSLLAFCDDQDGRKELLERISLQVRQLQALAIAAEKKGKSSAANHTKEEWTLAEVSVIKRKIIELQLRVDAEDNFRRDMAAKLMAVWDVLTSTKNFPIAEKLLQQSYTQALRTIDEDVTQRKDEAASSEGGDE
jgi:hypothetical protein